MSTQPNMDYRRRAIAFAGLTGMHFFNIERMIMLVQQGRLVYDPMHAPKAGVSPILEQFHSLLAHLTFIPGVFMPTFYSLPDLLSCCFLPSGSKRHGDPDAYMEVLSTTFTLTHCAYTNIRDTDKLSDLDASFGDHVLLIYRLRTNARILFAAVCPISDAPTHLLPLISVIPPESWYNVDTFKEACPDTPGALAKFLAPPPL